MAHSTRQTVLFEEQFSKPIVVQFDAETQSSDGGLLLLAAVDRRLGLTKQLAACLEDERDPSRVEHSIGEMFRQRVFGMAAGYEDANDAARTADDPILKEACGRSAIGGAALASQPTLSRFESAPDARQLLTLQRRLEKSVIKRHRKRLGKHVHRITIDLDPTDDPTHGQQPFSFFNGHYDNHCYLPMLAFLTFGDEPTQYLYSARLRPGNATAARTAIRLLRRTIKQLRANFPHAIIRVRLDGGFAVPRLLAFLDANADEYVVGMPGNPKLNKIAEPYLDVARKASALTGETTLVFADFEYATESWPHKRRLICKAEVTRFPGREPKDNPRFIVTKLPGKHAEEGYGIYRGRGDIENRIKELHHGLNADRTSCTRYLANQFRLLMAATAYVLYQELRLLANCRKVASFQVTTLRDRFVKIGARVIESVRRIVLRFPAAYPWTEEWIRIARAIGAT